MRIQEPRCRVWAEDCDAVWQTIWNNIRADLAGANARRVDAVYGRMIAGGTNWGRAVTERRWHTSAAVRVIRIYSGSRSRATGIPV